MYLTGLDFAKELSSIEKLVSSLNRATDIVASVDSWWTQYTQFVNDQLPSTEAEWSETLTNFLFRLASFKQVVIVLFFALSPKGLRFTSNFKFESSSTPPEPLQAVCGQPAPPILLSTFEFTHVKFEVAFDHPHKLIALVGQRWAHPSAEQGERHNCWLQLLWECLCLDPGKNSHFWVMQLIFRFAKKNLSIVILIVIHSSTGVQQLGDGRGYHKRAFPEPWDCARMCVCHHTNPARKPPWIYHRAPMCRNHTGTLYHD